MIFTALGLLVVAAGMLIAGVAKSSVLLLMLSLVFTVAAGASLAIAYSVARRSGVITEGAAPGAKVGAVGSPFATASMPPADGSAPTVPVVMYVPVDQLPAMSGAGVPMHMGGNGVGAGVGNGNGNGARAGGAGAAPPIADYDEMTAEQVGKLITSGVLSESQLQAVREYEAAHAARKSVLSRIDRRLYSQ